LCLSGATLVILVIGATGTIGRELVPQLAARHARFRVLARDPDKARALLGGDVALVAGDLADPGSLTVALTGIEQVFLLSTNAPEQVELQGNLITAAKATGVSHILKVSGFHPERDLTNTLGYWHLQTERQLEASRIPHTLVRPSFFLQNLPMLARTMPEGIVIEASASPTAKVAFIDARDIAAVAAEILTNPAHQQRNYQLTGPRAISFPDLADAIATATGTPTRYKQLDAQQASTRLGAIGMPAWLITYVLGLYRAFDNQIGAEVSTDLQDLLGKPGRDHHTFAHDHATAFTPSALQR
jgi:uncharacterized protein YbjT (DUF2867 family)